MTMPLSPSNVERFEALFFALVIGYGFIILPAQYTWTNYWLTKDGQQGMAVVTKVLWTGHNGVAYRYRVNQKEYTGAGGRSWQDAKYRLVMPGDQTIVYFSSSHPWLSRLNRPRTAMIEGLPVLLLAWFFEVLFIITVINPKSKWALKSGGSQAKSQTSQ
jgi:hypothetical protein